MRYIPSFHRRSTINLAQRSVASILSPIERYIRYYIEALPYYKPGYSIQVCLIITHHHQIPLFEQDIKLICPPPDCLPFCDSICMRSLLNCLSISHITQIISTLLSDGKVLMHSRNV